ncbi:MAG: heme o synthase [Candidatus Dormibacteraeota bacterium]|nr:heme o synthase [Candidatus Dormibacteraeota bacterium]
MSTPVGVRGTAALPVAVGATLGRARSVAADYLSLTKPRIIVLLLITELTSMVVVAGTLPNLRQVFAAVVGGFCAAGGSGALNCWWDRDIDTVMRRTASRPLPSGRLSPVHAVAFGLGLNALAAIVLWLAASPAAAALALLGTAYYVGIYTMTLKRRTSQNIVIGGAAGAVPVLVGSVIATGHIGWLAVTLFAIVFFWTPPHSWALALVYRRDYVGATVPMLPAVTSHRATLRAILAYLVLLVAVSMLPTLAFGAVYAVPVGALNLYYLVLAVRALRSESISGAGKLFHYSLVYLAAVFALCAGAALLGG